MLLSHIMWKERSVVVGCRRIFLIDYLSKGKTVTLSVCTIPMNQLSGRDWIDVKKSLFSFTRVPKV